MLKKSVLPHLKCDVQKAPYSRTWTLIELCKNWKARSKIMVSF